MPKKTTGLSTKERKIIRAKFSLTREQLAAQLAAGDKVTTRAARPAGKTGKVARTKAAKARGMEAPVATAATSQAERKYFPEFPVGKLDGEPRLVWIAPDLFRHEPNPDKPFRFTRSNGEVIQPGLMITDGGSIPRALWFIKDLSPWSYVPAFLVHDWLFDLHHCNRTDKPFEEVRDIMLEGVRTLMETKVCPLDRLAFDAIYTGIDSFVARQVWNIPGCHLP